MVKKKSAKKMFPGLLSTIRQTQGLSQQELADLSGLQPTAISHYENGSRSPSLTNLSKLATALNVTADALIGREAQTAARCIIGWRETVSIPGWGVNTLVAKVDTGARTSSIHVTNLKHLRGDDISFDVVLRRRKPVRLQSVTTALVRMTNVKSSNGHIQERIVVRERIHIGNVDKVVDLTLSVRDKMSCRMLLGRTALGDDFLINVDEKYAMNGVES